TINFSGLAVPSDEPACGHWPASSRSNVQSPCATNTSRSFSSSVQSTVTSSRPPSVVLNTVRPSLPAPRLSEPWETTRGGGSGVGVGVGAGSGGAVTPPPPQPKSASATLTTRLPDITLVLNPPTTSSVRIE